jgi:hypothetical protein
MASAALPGANRHKSVSALFGDDADSEPLWFKKDTFAKADFDSEAYIRDLRRFVAFDTLRTELRGHLGALKNELVELINRDYTDFVNLSTKLVDVDGAVLRMRMPLNELRARLVTVRESVHTSLAALQDGLKRRADASASREVLELLLDTSHVVSKVSSPWPSVLIWFPSSSKSVERMIAKFTLFFFCCCFFPKKIVLGYLDCLPLAYNFAERGNQCLSFARGCGTNIGQSGSVERMHKHSWL